MARLLPRALLGRVPIGAGRPVVVMAALNVSRESFYPASVVAGRDALLRAAERMVATGAQILDVGAMSSAPYLETTVGAEEEADRLGEAVGALSGKLGVPVSADTSRSLPARAAIQAGAGIINDVTGLAGDPEMAGIVSTSGVGLVLVASAGAGAVQGDPLDVVKDRLQKGLDLAEAAGVDPQQIVVDPGIGFFRHADIPWYEWDCRVLARLGRLGDLGRPIGVGVSRKSFIGALGHEPDPANRLPGTLAATAAAVLAGAHLIRCHDVAETIQAVRVAEAVLRARAEA